MDTFVGTGTRATAIMLRRHFTNGWWLVGGYVKKWFWYSVYALAIEVVFVVWLFVIFAVSALATAVHPWAGVGVGVLALLSSPVVLSMFGSRRG